MDKAALIDKLNHAISLELCAVIQYNHYHGVLMGLERRTWEGLFEKMSSGALEDAREFSFRVTVLGGKPTVEHAPIKQASSIHDMLNNALELEKALVDAYTAALDDCQDNVAYRNRLEEQVLEEHDEVEELEMYLSKVQKVTASKPASADKKSA